MMPVRSFDWDFDNIFGLREDPLFQMEQTLGPDFYSLLPSEDIWKKFEINDVPMPDFRASDIYMTDDDGGAGCDLDVALPATRTVSVATKEIRHHDCMWAGRCVSKDHKTVEKEEGKTQEVQVTVRPTARRTVRSVINKKDNVVVVDDNNVVAVTSHTTCSSNTNRTLKPNVTVLKSASILKTGLTLNMNNTRINNVCAKPTNAGRSLLRTPVKAYVAPPVLTDSSYALDSDGDSPRPETPSSESEDEGCNNDFDFKHNLDLSSSVAAVCADERDDVSSYDDYRTQVEEGGDCTSSSSDDCDDIDDYDSVLPNPTTAVSVSDVTGQNLSGPAPSVADVTVKTEGYFNSDHCYHLNKIVHLDSLGVQTPSDSEEEIDVVSFYDSEAQPTSRSSSCGGTSLPTNPSDRDRQQLQLAVKSAITKRQGDSATPIRISLGGKIVLNMRTLGAEMAQANKTLKQEKNRKKRSATFSSDEDRTIFKKGVKRMKRQYHHRLQHHKMTTIRSKKANSTGSSSPRSGGSGSSDSEPESLEKRSMHNNMERQRRVDLRNLVEGLRALVPSVETKNRAAKVVILKEASVYCQDLTEEYEEKTAEAAALRLKQYKLRQKLSQLRRACANLR